MKLDSSKADPVKAEAYLRQLEEEWNQDSGDQDSTQAESGEKEGKSEVKPDIQQEIYTEGDNKLTFLIKDNASSDGWSNGWWASAESVQTVLNFSLDAEGSDIETLNFSLNQGEFCSNPTNDLRELKSNGNKCSISLDELKDKDHLYSILFNADLKDYAEKSGNKNSSIWGKREYDALNQAIEATRLNCEIIMKDGSIINKILTFDNISDDNFSISVSAE